MAFFRRSDPQLSPSEKMDKTKAKSQAKAAREGWASTLKNEAATARGLARTGTTAPRPVERRAADRYVIETAEHLESTRPSGRSRRSPDPDRGGFAAEGIFAARKPDVGGRIPVERWPSETRGGQGCSCGHPKCTN